MRSQPNIIITGTPGVGKTTHCEALSQATGLKHFSITQIVKDRGCHEGWDDEYQSWIVDEDKVRMRGTATQNGLKLVPANDKQLLDSIEDELKDGGYIIDWHACDLFPKSWVDLVVVLRVDSATLYDRLTERGYAEVKLQENLDSEIMEVILDEAREAFDSEIVVELTSNNSEEMENNTERVEAWVKQWKRDNSVDS